MSDRRSDNGVPIPPWLDYRLPLAAVAIGLAVVLAVSLSGCAGRAEEPTGGSAEPTRSAAEPTGGSVEPTSSAVPSAADVAAARQLIETADLGDEATIDAIEGVRFTPAGEEAARAVLASSASGDVLWAATLVYASSASDPAPLGPLLQNADASIRTMAAAALVALGDGSGFAVLAASLSDADQLRGSHPPMSIGSFAASTLSRYVQATDAPQPPTSEAELATVEASWSAWLRGHGNELQFDAPSRTWKTP